MALVGSNGMPVGTPAPAFALPDVDGRVVALDDLADAKVLVVVFTCNHCPYAKASEDRLIAIQRDYADRGVRLVAINPNVATHPGDTAEKMIERAREKGFNFPYLSDESQAVARAYDAACTPDVFVFGEDRTLVYNGRIDDDWRDLSAVTHHDLRQVIEATLEGRPHGLEEVVASMGCSIKWSR